MMPPPSDLSTLPDAVAHFDDARSDALLRKLRWPRGRATCYACGSTRIGAVATRGLLRCMDCRAMLYDRVGTIFAESRLPMSKWWPLVWALANGVEVSTSDLADVLAVNRKSATSMRERLRAAMNTDEFAKAVAPSRCNRFEALAARLVAVSVSDNRP